MSYSEYEFGDFRKIYDSGPSDGLVGFAEGFAKGFVPAYQSARQARIKQEDDLFKLAVSDIQEREKLKAKANTKLSDYASNAKTLAKNYPNLPGVEAYIYNGLASGMTSNQISSDLQTAIKDGRIRTTTDGVTTNPFAPETKTDDAPVVSNDEVSSVEAQTETVLSENTANEPMSAGDYLVSRMESGEAGENIGEGVQVADNSGNWFTNYFKNVEANRLAIQTRNVQSRVDEWKAATGRDVTSASGLTDTTSSGPVTSVSTEVKSGSDSATAVGTVLSIIPKLDENDAATAIGMPKIGDITTVNDAIVARGVADNTDGPEAKKASEIAGTLITELSPVPKLGEMSLPDLNILVGTDQSNMGPEYSGLNPSVYKMLQAEAKDLIETKQRAQLPSLAIEKSITAEGHLADIKTGKYGDIPMDGPYVTQLMDTISALKTKEAIAEAKIDGDDFTMDDWENLRANKLRTAFAEGGPKDDEGRPLTYVAWENGEGQFLKTFAEQAEQRKLDGKDPEVFTSPVQAATNTFLRSEEAKAMSSDEITNKLVEIKKSFDTQDLKLTAADVAGLSNYYRDLATNGTPEQKTEAEAWLKTKLPQMQKAVADGSPKSAVPAEEQLFTYTNSDGQSETAYGFFQEDGSVRLSGTFVDGKAVIIQKENLVSSLSADGSDAAQRGAARLGDIVKTQLTEGQSSAVDFVRKAYDLSKLVEDNEEVLLAGGQAASIFETAKTQLGSLFSFAARTADGMISPEGSTQRSKVLEQLNKTIDADKSMNLKTKQAYRQYINQTVVLIFKAGESLGSTGQAFSNQDYNRLRDAFIGATSLVELNAVLQNFSKGLIETQDFKANQILDSTAVQQIISLPGVEAGIEFEGATGFMKNNGLEEQLAWANSEPAKVTTQASNTSAVENSDKSGEAEAKKLQAEAQASLQSWMDGKPVVWTQAMETEFKDSVGKSSGIKIGSQVKLNKE